MKNKDLTIGILIGILYTCLLIWFPDAFKLYELPKHLDKVLFGTAVICKLSIIYLKFIKH